MNFLTILQVLFKAFIIILLFQKQALASTDMGLSLRTQYFNYEEFDTGGISLNKETGFIPGIGASMHHQSHSLSMDFYDGTVDYDGQTQSGTPHQTDTDARLLKLAYRYRIPFSDQPDKHGYYLGLNYRYWERDIQSTVNVNGLYEVYTWWTAEAGVKSVLLQGPVGKLHLEMGLIQVFLAEISIDLRPFGYGEPVLDIGNKTGLQAALFYTGRFSQTYDFIIGADYNYSKFGRSDSAQLSNGFNTIIITEPDSTSNHITLYVELIRSF